MAKATVNTAVEIVKTEVREEVIQLTLSKLEARALMALTGFPYGGNTTYNREIQSIRRAVNAAGKFGYIPASNYFRIDNEGDIEAQAHRPADN